MSALLFANPSSRQLARSHATQPTSSIIRPIQLLIVEDDSSVRTLLARILAAAGRVIAQAANVDEAEQIVAHQSPDVVIADVVMPGRSGIDLRRAFTERFPGVPVILISGYSPEQVAEFVARTPSTTFLPKPFSISDLREMVETALAGRGFPGGTPSEPAA